MVSPTFSLNPTDIRNDPASFFAQLDLYFKQKVISRQADKFCQVAAILPQAIIAEVRELISPPMDKPYDILPERVTTAVTVSSHRQISQLLRQEHIDHVHQVFERLKQYGLVLNPLKYVFGQSEVTFFGTPYLKGENFPIARNSLHSGFSYPCYHEAAASILRVNKLLL